MATPRVSRRNAISWSLQIAVIASCCAYALWDVNFGQLAAALGSYDWTRVVALVAFSLIAYVILGVRLVVLMRALPGAPDLSTTFLASVLALGMNNLLPARLGELAKALYLRQRCNASAGQVMGAVFWERFADIHALLALSALALLSQGQTSAFLPLAIAVALGWSTLVLLRIRPAPFDWLCSHIPGQHVRAFGRDVLTYLRDRLGIGVSLELTLWTVAVWFVYAMHVYLALVWVAELTLSPLQVLMVFLSATLGMVVPVSPGGLGVYEVLAVLVLGWYGVPPDIALAAALTAHMTQYIPTTIAGAIILSRADVSIASLRNPSTIPVATSINKV
jgi:uncharacterized membrane protein YbhN (UPF0104 family)